MGYKILKGDDLSDFKRIYKRLGHHLENLGKGEIHQQSRQYSEIRHRMEQLKIIIDFNMVFSKTKLNDDDIIKLIELSYRRDGCTEYAYVEESTEYADAVNERILETLKARKELDNKSKV